MEGLTSIALAVAHLERTAVVEKKNDGNADTSENTNKKVDVVVKKETVKATATATATQTKPQPLAPAPSTLVTSAVPPRRDFSSSHGARMVSTDSFNAESLQQMQQQQQQMQHMHNMAASNHSHSHSRGHSHGHSHVMPPAHMYQAFPGHVVTQAPPGYWTVQQDAYSQTPPPAHVSAPPSQQQQQQQQQLPYAAAQKDPSEPAEPVHPAIPEAYSSVEDTEELARTVPPPPPATEVITQILKHDVLCGRGGETNHHAGNIQYRTLVKCYQPLYIASKRRDKPRIAQKIVLTVRQRGGRFLKKVGPRFWKDVGNTKAREKTSQALREGAPELRSTGTRRESKQAIRVQNTVVQQQQPHHPAPLSAATRNMIALLNRPPRDAHYGGARPIYHHSPYTVATTPKMPSMASNLPRTAVRKTPTVVEASRGDISERPTKRRRSNLVALASTVTKAAKVPELPVDKTPAVPPASPKSTTEAPARTPSVSPTSSYSGALSDDSDSARSSKGGGPRLKLLKQRLKTDE